MNSSSQWSAVLVAVCYLGVVVLLIFYCGWQTDTFAEYSQYWGLFATLVGVTTGAIPSFFFKAQADKATDRANKESTKAQLLAGVADPTRVKELHDRHQSLFSS